MIDGKYNVKLKTPLGAMKAVVELGSKEDNTKETEDLISWVE